jgi:hypothetical protein
MKFRQLAQAGEAGYFYAGKPMSAISIPCHEKQFRSAIRPTTIRSAATRLADMPRFFSHRAWTKETGWPVYAPLAATRRRIEQRPTWSNKKRREVDFQPDTAMDNPVMTETSQPYIVTPTCEANGLSCGDRMRGNTRRVRWKRWVALAVASAAFAGCTTLPASSAAQHPASSCVGPVSYCDIYFGS